MRDLEQQLLMRYETRECYQVNQDSHTVENLLCISTEQIRDGIVQQLTKTPEKSTGARNFLVLLVIAAHMNKRGKAFPSLKTICELTGYSKPTVIAAIDELTEIRIGGKPVLSKKKVSTQRGHKKSIYYFTANPENTMPEDLAEEIVEKETSNTQETADKLNSKTVLLLFMDEYEKAFNIKYVPNYGRDLGQIKNKLIGKFSDSDLKAAITMAVSEYQNKWSSAKYPYPTVGMLTTWLINEAIKQVQINKKEEQQFEDRVAEAERYESINPIDLLD